MPTSLTYLIALVFGGFAMTSVVLHILQKKIFSDTGSLRTDPWFYLWTILAAGLGLIYAFMPTYADFVAKFSSLNVAVWCGLALLIYIVYLFETDWLTFAVIVISSIVTSLLIPHDFFVFGGLLPLWLDRLSMALIICAFTYGASFLNGMAGIYGLQMVCIGLGLAVISFLGGIPLLLGFMGAFTAGVWLGFTQLNWYPADIEINDGACMSGGFLICGLLLQGTIEFAGPSMLVLSMYVWAELVFIFVNRYLLNQRYLEIYQNTAYYSIFSKGIELSVISFSVVKILMVNFVLALFQLKISSPFSMPIFAMVADLWLLNITYRASAGPMTLKEANQEFIKNIKEGLASLKQPSQKDKE